MLIELKACFMEAYDDNQDGKIDIREVGIFLNTATLLENLQIQNKFHVFTPGSLMLMHANVLVLRAG